MIPIRFGRASALVGEFHRAEAPAPRAPAVLLLNPFGQEAIRCHRLYRVLADRLSRTGMPALRFDYRGTGDSLGDDADVDIGLWLEDIAEAHAELRRLAGQSRIVWFGARLGASLAVLASAAVESRPERCILWEPVLAGAPYLDSLHERHVEHLIDTLGHAGTTALRPSRATIAEASGFAVPARFARQLEIITPDRIVHGADGATHVIGPRALLDDWQRMAGPSVALSELATPFDWNSEEALNSALVPAAAVQALMRAAEAGG